MDITKPIKVSEFNLSDIEFKGAEVEIPNFTTAVIEKRYEELKGEWVVGEQIADEEGNILSRTYTELEFEEKGERFDLEDVGYEKEEYEGRYFYRVTNKFYETEYISTKGKRHNNFMKWEKGENEYMQEVIYKHKQIAIKRWEREYRIISYGGIDNTVGSSGSINTFPIYQEEESSSIYTGTGMPVNKVIEGEVKLIQYKGLIIPFYRDIEVGKALGAVVESDGDFEVTDIEGEEVERKNGIILLKKDKLRIKFNSPTKYLPTYIEVKFYGEELWRSVYPGKLDEEAEILLHEENVINKYKPPGRSDFPDNFWNNGSNNRDIEKFSIRQGINPEWV